MVLQDIHFLVVNLFLLGLAFPGSCLTAFYTFLPAVTQVIERCFCVRVSVRESTDGQVDLGVNPSGQFGQVGPGATPGDQFGHDSPESDPWLLILAGRPGSNPGDQFGQHGLGVTPGD